MFEMFKMARNSSFQEILNFPILFFLDNFDTK